MYGVKTYRDDPTQTVQHFSFIATVEEFLNLNAIERLGRAAGAAGGRGGIEGELSGWNRDKRQAPWSAGGHGHNLKRELSLPLSSSDEILAIDSMLGQ